MLIRECSYKLLSYVLCTGLKKLLMDCNTVQVLSCINASSHSLCKIFRHNHNNRYKEGFHILSNITCYIGIWAVNVIVLPYITKFNIDRLLWVTTEV